MAWLTTHPDDQERLDISTTWTDKPLIEQVPGARWDARRKTWTVARSWSACVQLRSLFGADLGMDEDVRTWARGERERVDLAVHLRDQTSLYENDESEIAKVIRSWRQ